MNARLTYTPALAGNLRPARRDSTHENPHRDWTRNHQVSSSQADTSSELMTRNHKAVANARVGRRLIPSEPPQFLSERSVCRVRYYAISERYSAPETRL